MVTQIHQVRDQAIDTIRKAREDATATIKNAKGKPRSNDKTRQSEATMDNTTDSSNTNNSNTGHHPTPWHSTQNLTLDELQARNAKARQQEL